MDENLKKSMDSIIHKLEKHFSRDNDDRHDQPWDWEIGDGHDELEDEQLPHGEREGKRRMATALTALRRNRGKSNIPKWLKLTEMTIEELNALGEKHYGDKWEEVLAQLGAGASENFDVKDVTPEMTETEADGPVNPEVSKAREMLKELARSSNLSVKDVEALTDAEVLRMARELG